MKIYLIRHGHYLPGWKQEDGFLTDKGEEQIAKLGLRFLKEKVNFKKIYSSPKIRARESAKSCCKVLGIEKIIYSDDLVEIEYGEGEEEVIQRMQNFLNAIKPGFSEGAFGVFSHYHSIKYLLNSFNSDPSKNSLPHAGVALIDYSLENPKIVDYDFKKHLKGIESY